MRKPQVTRTITSTVATVLCLNVNTAEAFNKTVTVPREHSDEKLLKIIKKMVDNDEVKVVHIVDKEIVETLYGMSEEKFIEYADVLPPRKTNETNE